MYFKYGNKELAYLKSQDKVLGEIIDKVGMIQRETDSDLFSSVVHHIIGQQISTKAQATIWQRMQEYLGEINAANIAAANAVSLQALGMTFRKAEYIKDFAAKVINGSFDLEKIAALSDEAAIKELVTLKGIGVWTAEMILLFCLQRPDIFSFDDLAIQRGLRMVYHHRKIDRQLFEKYRRRFSPYCSVASLYLWAAAGGAVPELKDYLPDKKAAVKKKAVKRTADEEHQMYISYYHSPLGKILLAADEIGLAGIWLEGQKYYGRLLKGTEKEADTPLLLQAKQWLDVYFSGRQPDFSVPMHFIGTEFQQEVWQLLCSIPYGQTVTYGQLAEKIAGKRGLRRMSAQAVGGAVGHNPLTVMVPCHRVVGQNGSLTGYAGGIERKIQLLKLENVNLASFFIPRKGSAL